MNTDELTHLGAAIAILSTKLNKINQFIPYLVYTAPKDEHKNIEQYSEHELRYMLKDLEEFFSNIVSPTIHQTEAMEYSVKEYEKELEKVPDSEIE